MTEIRKNLRTSRKNLSSEYKTKASISLASETNLNSLLQSYQNVKSAGIYLALKEEMNIHPLIEKLWLNNIRTFSPLLHPTKPRHLFFIEYSNHSQLTTDKYGIATPKFEADNILAPWELDIVFTPLVGFDLQGNRIGMGAGFYDTSFAYRSILKESTPLIGCAFDCQYLDHINSNTWDQPLNGILTESRYINIR